MRSVKWIIDTVGLYKRKIRRFICVILSILFIMHTWHVLIQHGILSGLKDTIIQCGRIKENTYMYEHFIICTYDIKCCINMFFVQGCFILIILLWIYGGAKLYNGNARLKDYMKNLTGKSQEAEAFWRRYEDWLNPTIRDTDSPMCKFVKVGYFISWIVLSVLAVISMKKLDYLTCNVFGLITVATYILCQYLCYFSYWACLAFSWNIRKLSIIKSLVWPRESEQYENEDKLKEYAETIGAGLYGGSAEEFYDDLILKDVASGVSYEVKEVSERNNPYYFNLYRPSETFEFQRLLNVTNMVPLAFFVIVLLYSLSFAITWLFHQHIPAAQPEKDWMVCMLLCVTIPGMISFIPVLVFPIVFVRRIHRRWKWRAMRILSLVREYERSQDKNHKDRMRDNKYWEDVMCRVITDRITYSKGTLFLTILTLLANIGCFVIALLDALKQL